MQHNGYDPSSRTPGVRNVPEFVDDLHSPPRARKRRSDSQHAQAQARHGNKILSDLCNLRFRFEDKKRRKNRGIELPPWMGQVRSFVAFL
jgi:hypothetical protein